MKFFAILLIALTTLVCATPSPKYAKKHSRNPVEGDAFSVPIVEIDNNFQEILSNMEEDEDFEDKLNIPIDSPKDHLGMHYIDTPEEMEEMMGVSTQNINPDLIEDAFLLVVSIRDNMRLHSPILFNEKTNLNSQNLFVNMDTQLNDTMYVRVMVICWKCIEFHSVR